MVQSVRYGAPGACALGQVFGVHYDVRSNIHRLGYRSVIDDPKFSCATDAIPKFMQIASVCGFLMVSLMISVAEIMEKFIFRIMDTLQNGRDFA